MEHIIKDLKNYKTSGEDDINPELLKLAENDLMAEIYFLVKDIWNKECVPKDWNLGIIRPILKKRDMNVICQYHEFMYLLFVILKNIFTESGIFPKE